MPQATSAPDSTPPSFAELRSVIEEASGWEELVQGLSERSIGLEARSPRSLVLRSGDTQLPWPSGVEQSSLSRRFGEPFTAFKEREEARQRIAKGLGSLGKASSWDQAQESLQAQGLRLSLEGSPALAAGGHAEPIPEDLLTRLEAHWRHPFRDWQGGLPPRPDPAVLQRHVEHASSWRDLSSRLASERVQWDFDSSTGKLDVFDEHARRVALPAAPEVSTLERRFREPFRTTALDAHRWQGLEAAVREAESWPDLAGRLGALGIRLERSGNNRTTNLVDVGSGLPIHPGERPHPLLPVSKLEERFGQLAPWAKAVVAVEKAVEEASQTSALRERLEIDQSRAAGLARDLEAQVSRYERLERQLADAEAAFRTHLAEAFRPAELAQVEQALEAHLGQNGHRVTAQALHRRPQRFGRLLGRGGPFPNAERREARAAAEFAATRLRSLHELRRRLSALPTPPDRAAVETARETSVRATRYLRQLPSQKQSMARVAGKIREAGGIELVGTGLSPGAFRIATAALALAGRAAVQEAER